MNKFVLYIGTIILLMSLPVLLSILLIMRGNLDIDDGWGWALVLLALGVGTQIVLAIGGVGTMICHFLLKGDTRAKNKFYYPLSLLCYLIGAIIACIFLLNETDIL